MGGIWKGVVRARRGPASPTHASGPDFSHWARGFFTDDFEYDPAAREKFWKDERLPELLASLADAWPRSRIGITTPAITPCASSPKKPA